MSRLRCICNTETGQWDFAPLDLHHNYCDVEIVFTNNSAISNIDFGVTVATDGNIRYEHAFGPEYAYNYDMQNDYYNSVRIDYPIASTITVETWAKTGEQTLEGVYEFSRPNPPQPFPSWSLVDGSWAPPVPHPEDGLYYNWSEDTQAWIRVEFDEATQTWIEVTE